MPFWSPDSRSIAFFTASRLQRIDVSGGPPRALCEVDGLAYGGSWSPRGDILFAIDSLRAAGRTPGIRHVRDTGGTPAQVTTLDQSRGETGHRSPQFLPDGGSFIFTALGQRTEIRAGSLQNRTTKLLVADAMLPAFVPPGTLLFLRQESVMAMSLDPQKLEVNGTERVIVSQGVGGFSAADHTIAFSSEGAVLRKIQWVSRDGRRTAAAGEPGPYYSLSLSPSGRRVALQRREVTGAFSGSDIWVLEFATGVLSRMTSDQDFEGDPSWSPDEKSLAFTARRQGRWQILRKDLTTGTEAPFGPVPQPGNLDEWTPDGRFLIFRIAGRTNPGGCGDRRPAAAGHRRRAGRHRGSSASVAGRALDRVQRERVGEMGGLRRRVPGIHGQAPVVEGRGRAARLATGWPRTVLRGSRWHPEGGRGPDQSLLRVLDTEPPVRHWRSDTLARG